MERTREIHIEDLSHKDLGVLKKVAELMKEGDLNKFQVLRKTFTDSNIDNLNIGIVPESKDDNLAHIGTLLVISNLLYSFDDLIRDREFRIPTSSLATLKSFASSLGSYMLNSLSESIDNQDQESLREVSESLTKLQIEIEGIKHPPISWIQL